MPYDDARTEIAPETGDGLRGEVNLRNQYQRLITCPQVLFQVVQIDFRFAATGNSV